MNNIFQKKDNYVHKVKCPLRICLAGGGTDLETYYKKYSGLVISAAINKYITVEFKDGTKNGIYVKTVLEYFDIYEDIKITSDLEGRSGLGSSGSLMVALVALCAKHNKINYEPWQIAETAYHIEHTILGQPCGKQDHYIAAYGGIKAFHISTNGYVDVEDLDLDLSRIVIFDTGVRRNSSKSLVFFDNKNMIKKLRFVHGQAAKFMSMKYDFDIDKYGKMLYDYWKVKRQMHPEMSNVFINNMIELGLNLGAIGGKLIGAGGGGYILFIKNDNELYNLPLNSLNFKIEERGIQYET